MLKSGEPRAGRQLFFIRERGNINERKRSGERKGEEGRGEETPFC